MFIKDAFERRLKKEQEQDQDGILQARHSMSKVGSIKNGKINFDRDEQFFSQDDIPKHALDIKKQVKELIDLDILNLKQKPWNASSLVPKNPLQEETHERKLMKIKLGLYDRPASPPKEKKITVGTETRDDYTGWNVSTQQDKSYRRDALEEFTLRSSIKAKEKEDILLVDYRKPLRQQSDLIHYQREVKKQERYFRDDIRKKFTNDNPQASKERVDGSVFRLAYEAKLRKNQIEQDVQVTFKPELYMPQEDKRIKAQHTGLYQKFGFEKDVNGSPKETFAWSCCMSSEKDSEGCNKLIIDKKKWIYASFVS